MTSPILLGIDVGTSSTKSLVLSSDGRVLGVAAQETPVSTPRPGWAEQNPDGWVDAVLATARRAVAAAGVDASAIQAVGLAGQMHGTVCVGPSGVPLRPAVIWADQRSSRQVAELQTWIGAQRLAMWTANPVATGFMLPTWLWLQANEPAVARATHWLLLPKDYVRYRLTGSVGTEPSDAASTSLFDPVQRTWSTPLVATLGLDAAVLPEIFTPPPTSPEGSRARLRQQRALFRGHPWSTVEAIRLLRLWVTASWCPVWRRQPSGREARSSLRRRDPSSMCQHCVCTATATCFPICGTWRLPYCPQGWSPLAA